MLDRISMTLPVHPTSGLTALGIVGGRPVWPVMGAADDDDGDDKADDKADDDDGDDKADDKADDDDGDDKALGPKGERALAAEKDKRRKAQAELREYRALGVSAADAKKILDAAKNASGDKPDPERIKAEARAEAQTELARERVVDKIEVKAAKLFADPDDAAALLLRENEHDDFLDDNGKIDVEAIEDALKKLLEKKPYLGVAQGDGRRFKGGGDGGARKDARPNQLSREALSRMSPEEIVKAKAAGRLDDVLAGKG